MPVHKEVMDAASFADLIWHPALHYPIIFVWFLYEPFVYMAILCMVCGVLALPACLLCPTSLFIWTAVACFMYSVWLFFFFTWCYVLPWAIALFIFHAFLAIPWMVVIPVTWTFGQFWCYWMALVGSYGVFQLLMAMDYAQFWAAKGKELTTKIEPPAAE